MVHPRRDTAHGPWASQARTHPILPFGPRGVLSTAENCYFSTIPRIQDGGSRIGRETNPVLFPPCLSLSLSRISSLSLSHVRTRSLLLSGSLFTSRSVLSFPRSLSLARSCTLLLLHAFNFSLPLPFPFCFLSLPSSFLFLGPGCSRIFAMYVRSAMPVLPGVPFENRGLWEPCSVMCQFCVTSTLTAFDETTGIVPGEYAWCNLPIHLSGRMYTHADHIQPRKLHEYVARREYTRKMKEPSGSTIRVNFTRAISDPHSGAWWILASKQNGHDLCVYMYVRVCVCVCMCCIWLVRGVIQFIV